MRMLDSVRESIEAYKRNDPAARSAWEIVLLYSGFHATQQHRLAHWLHTHDMKFAARAVSQFTRLTTGIEIHPGAKIGRRLVIDHGSGVVIGETVEIGDDCLIYQGATLGGAGITCGKRHPTLGNNVMVGSGAKVLGPFKVGDNAKIAANAVVLESVPANSTAVGVPARIVKQDGKRTLDLDQVHIPDPVSQELCRDKVEIEKLKKRIEKLERLLEEKYSEER